MGSPGDQSWESRKGVISNVGQEGESLDMGKEGQEEEAGRQCMCANPPQK
jgi:hypothetical protein